MVKKVGQRYKEKVRVMRSKRGRDIISKKVKRITKEEMVVVR